MKTIIIAHERATSLEPFTSTRPRSMIPILNVPVIGHVSRQLTDAGIKEVTILIGHLKEKVKDYLGDGNTFGMKINYLEVADDAKFSSAICEIFKKMNGPVFLIDGGTYMEKGLLKDFTEKIDKEKNQIALGENFNPLYHLQAVMEGENSIKEFKSVTIDQIKINQQSPLPEINAQMMFVSEKSLARLSEIIATGKAVSMENIVDACGKADIELSAIDTGKRFVQLHFPWEILAASYFGLDMEFSDESFQQIHPSAKVHPDAILKGTVIIGENTIVESGAVVDNVRIGSDCQINEHAYVKKSILASNCTVGPLGFVKGSVLGHKTKVGTPAEFPVAVAFGNAGYGHHCHAGMGVYGEGSGLMAGAIVTANRGNPIKVKIDGKLIDSGWFNIGAFVGDNTRINAQATVMPGKKLGPNSIIGPGIMVYSDVKPNTMLVLKQEIDERPIT